MFFELQMAHHNHEKNTLEVAVSVIGHERALRMQSFNNYRRRFNLRPYESFEDMTGMYRCYVHIYCDGHILVVFWNT